MRAFTTHTGLIAPLDRANIDTDIIIPKQFLKSVKRTGFGPNLFDELRYLDEGKPGDDVSQRTLNHEFIINIPPYDDATILLTRENFGCGSSREHAPWALQDFGFRVLIAPSFADIFYNNCFKNGLLPIILPKETINLLFTLCSSSTLTIEVNLQKQQITVPENTLIDFSIEPFRKKCLIEGLDDIGLTLEHAKLIQDYERKRKKVTPWLFEDI